MKVKMTMRDELFEDIKSALAWDGRERAAWLLCHSSSCGKRLKLLPYRVMMPEEVDYTKRSGGSFELKTEFTDRALGQAIEEQAEAFLVHVHPPGLKGAFSGVDDGADPLFLGHLAGLIDGIHLGSMVFDAEFTSLDARLLDRRTGELIPLEKVLVVGPDRLDVFIPAGQDKVIDKPNPRLARTVSAFGREATVKMGWLDFGLVGVSGLGGQLAEILVRGGAGSVLLCDPDAIETSNLNRLPGATPGDIGQLKVDFFEDHLGRIDPDAEIHAFGRSFYDDRVQRAFSQADVIFGATDSGARLSINRLALANLVPYFDLGAGIERDNGRTTHIGGQVCAIIPGAEICLSCSGVFDDLFEEFLTPDEHRHQAEQGYLRGQPGVNPLVMYLDSIIAGLGYSRMLKYLWGLPGLDHFKIHYDDLASKVVPVKAPALGCLNCQPGGHLGRGDKVPFLAPANFRDKINMNLPEAILKERDKEISLAEVT